MGVAPLLARNGMKVEAELDWREAAGPFTCLPARHFSARSLTDRNREPDYERVTYGITMAAAQPLARLNPGMMFIYVSGAGTDTTEQGRVMWARVKGKTENALLRVPFRGAYMFRPGVIEPVRGVTSKTASYRFLYGLMKPLLPLLRGLFPNYILTTEEIGHAMLVVARNGAPKRVLKTHDIRAVLQSERV